LRLKEVGYKLKLNTVANNKLFAITDYSNILKKNNYNVATIRTYQEHFKRFLNYYPEIEPSKISNQQIREFILYLVRDKKYSTSSQNQAINSIKLYYQKVLQREIEDYYLPRPRKGKILPRVLNKAEVSKILKSITDLRSKCIIFGVYSAGLTPSEITYIKVDDIDSKKMQIFISSAKEEDEGRFAILSDKLLNLLREYFNEYKPKYWLFEGTSGKQFSKRTMQKIFQNAVKKSGINKPATLTILKNSFAVHLIEKGVDIRYVQQLLGHKSTKTTMKYLKISKRDLSVIKSPLDNLDI